MFIRQIKSRKSTCFQIGQKKYGKFVLAKHIGCATTPVEVSRKDIAEKVVQDDVGNMSTI